MYVFVYVCMYLYMYVCMYVCTYACMYVANLGTTAGMPTSYFETNLTTHIIHEPTGPSGFSSLQLMLCN